MNKKLNLTDEALSNLVNKNFQARSEMVQEVISSRSGFIEKWALFIFVSLLMVLMAASWFVSYPDIVEVKGKLKSNNGPKEIVPQQSGRLIQLFAGNDENVRQGQIVGIIESTANSAEVLQLSAQIDSGMQFLAERKFDKLPIIFSTHARHLGNIQQSYQIFMAAFRVFNDYVINGFYSHKKKMLIGDMASIKEINISLNEQKNINVQDKDLAQKSFEMNEILYKEKVISLEEYRSQKSRLLNKEINIPQINSSIISNQNMQREKLKEVEQLDHDQSQQKATFEQALQTLKSDVDEWVRKYTIPAPFDGTLSFLLPLQLNQYIEEGKLLGYVSPGDSKYFVEVSLPQINLGKIDTGMQVQLRFDAYPYLESGFVKGKIDYISKIASDSGFLATVNLENGLRTNLGILVQYKSGLRASAIIITKEMRLLKRLYYTVAKASSPGT